MKKFAIPFILSAAFALPATAQEELVCMQTAELEAALIDWYGETLVSQDTEDTYIWASGIGGTWTIVTYEPDGTSCTLAQGDNWSPGVSGDVLMARLELTNG